jgi:hypothetical protein
MIQGACSRLVPRYRVQAPKHDEHIKSTTTPNQNLNEGLPLVQAWTSAPSLAPMGQ